MLTHYQPALADVPNAEDFARGNLDGDIQMPKAPVRDPVVMDWDENSEPYLSPAHEVASRALASFFTRDGGWVYVTQDMLAQQSKLSRQFINRLLNDYIKVGKYESRKITTIQGKRGLAYRATGEDTDWAPTNLGIGFRRIKLAEFAQLQWINQLQEAVRDLHALLPSATILPDNVSAVLERLSDIPNSEEISSEWNRRVDSPDTPIALSTKTVDNALSERPASPATEKQVNTIMMHQERTGLDEDDVLASWPDIDRYSERPDGIDPSRMTSLQANRAIQWLMKQKDAPVEEPPAPPAAAEPVCTCPGEDEEELMDRQPEAEAAWVKTLAELEKELPRTTFDTWLKGTEGIAFKGKDLWVSVPSMFNVAWLEQRMYQTILRALRKSSGELFDVQFHVSPTNRGCLLHEPPSE